MKKYIDENVISFFASSITIIPLLIAVAKNDCFLMWLSILALFLIMARYVKRNIDEAMVLGGFLISFFTFILGMYVLQILAGDIKSNFSNSIFFEESICVYFSLLSLFWGYIFFQGKRGIIGGGYSDEKIGRYRQLTKGISDVSRKLFLVCIIFSIAVNIDKASMAFGNIYAIAGSVESRMPFLFQKIGEMNLAVFWIYLSTLPNKKNIKIPCYFYAFNAVVTIFSGVRNILVLDIITLGMYIYFRHKIRGALKEDKWLSNTTIWAILVSIPVMVVFLGLFAHIRLGEDAQYEGLIAGLIYFFEQQGGSADVIGRALFCKENGLLPDSNISYTFGPIISYFRNGLLGRIWGIEGSVSTTMPQDVELATCGNNLGATITYLLADTYYFMGGGFGTCYIAEVVVDFGYVGVVLFGLFLGWFLNNISYFKSDKWWKNAIGLLIFRWVIFMPRDFAFGFIASFFSFTNIIPLLVVMIFGRHMQSKMSTCEEIDYENCRNKYV